MDPFVMVRRLTAVSMRTVEGVLAAPDQVGALWGEVHELIRHAHTLLGRMDVLAARVEEELDRVDALIGASGGVVHDVEEVSDRTESVVGAVQSTRALADQQVRRVQELLDLYVPALERLVPVSREAAAALRPSHLLGLVRLLDELPRLIDRIEPALEGMGTVAPQLEEMTDRMDNVGQVVEGLPGSKLLKRRGQAREQEDQN